MELKNKAIPVYENITHTGCTKLMVAIIADIPYNDFTEVNLQNDKGWTALMLAVINDKKEWVKKLLANGADVNMTAKKRQTALIAFCYHECNNDEIMQLLLDNGADINLQDEYGSTALMLAVQYRFLKKVQFLLDNGADINLPDNNGNTPLMAAVINSDLEMIKLLLAKGAKASIKNDDNETSHMICPNGRKDIKELLVCSLFKETSDLSVLEELDDLYLIEEALEGYTGEPPDDAPSKVRYIYDKLQQIRFMPGGEGTRRQRKDGLCGGCKTE